MITALKALEWKGFPRRTALVVAVLGLVVLAGWALDVALLKSVLPGAVAMKANAALCFLLAGSALFLRLQSPADQKTAMQRTATGMALAVAAIGFATLSEYLFGWQLGIDQLLFSEADGALHTRYFGRMSPYAATGFASTGFVLFALPRPNLRLPVQWAAGLIILAGAVPLLGYLWNISSIATASITTPTAVHTALGLILLGAALLTATQTGRATSFKTVELKVLLGFVGALLLILFGGGITYRASASFADTSKWVAHTQEVRATLSDLHSNICDAESSQRAYLLSGAASQRDDYIQMSDGIPAQLEKLTRMVTDKTQLRNLDTLRLIVQHRLEILAHNVAVYESQGLAAAQREIISSKSLEATDNVHALADVMEKTEIDLLKQREASAEQSRQLTLALMLLTLLLATALLTALFVAIRREIKHRVLIQEQARDELEQRVQERTLALQTERDKLAAVFDSTTMGLVLTDASGGDISMNQTALKFHGFDSVEDMHRRVEEYADDWELRYPDGRLMPYTEWPLMRAIRGDYVRDLEVGYRHLKRDYRWICSITSSPVYNSAGEVILIILTLFDITERKNAEQVIHKLNAELEMRVSERTAELELSLTSLSASQENLSVTLNSIGDAVLSTDAEGRVVRLNLVAEQLSGWTRAEAVGRPIDEILHIINEKTRLPALLPVSDTIAQGTVHGLANHTILIARDGSERHIADSCAPIRNRAGAVIGAVLVFRDVTEEFATQAALHQAKEAAELANRTKDAFLANMSHELRTPLNAIIGFSEALKDGLMGEVAENQREYIDDIYTSGEHLLSLINDILDLAKVESGQMTLELEPVSLQAVLQNSLSMVKEKAMTHRLKLTLEADADMPEFLADTRKLKQIVYNLLSNAVKFTPDGGTVTLGAQRVDDMLEIAVTDTGIGISAENQARLFQPFTQIDSALSRQYQGTGLGLVMIKHLTELHGGSVGLESETGKGSRFWARIPWREAL